MASQSSSSKEFDVWFEPESSLAAQSHVVVDFQFQHSIDDDMLCRLKSEHQQSPYGGFFVDYLSYRLDGLEPDTAWAFLQQSVTEVTPIKPATTPKPAGAIRFVCISDTHTLDKGLTLPEGDVLIHAGDFSSVGKPREVGAFAEWLVAQDGYAHKVVIAGNHDVSFDPNGYEERRKRFRHPKDTNIQEVKNQLINAGHGVVYLEDSGIDLFGIKIWGSPWQPEFFDWAFNETRGLPLRKVWDKIPTGTDILITHGPPLGHGDKCDHGGRVGCADLLRVIQQRVKPKFHIFGHIHEGYGITTDGQTAFINASTCDFRYRPVQKPIVFDYIPGADKQWPLLANHESDVNAAAAAAAASSAQKCAEM